MASDIHPRFTVLSNEFAAVRLSIDTSGQSPRLRIDDLRHDRTAWLDAFQLAALASGAAAPRCSSQASPWPARCPPRHSP